MRVHTRVGTRSRLFTIVLTAMLLVSLVPAAAGAGTVEGLPAPDTVTTEWYVNSVSGSDSNTGLTADKAFKTITTAVMAADGADLVHLAQGTYSGEFPIFIDTQDDAIRFEGAGMDKTVLDGSETDFMFDIRSADVLFKNMTFKDGRNFGNDAGAVFAEYGVLSLVGCEFDTNYAAEGGAVSVVNAGLYVEGCDFHDNGYDAPDLELLTPLVEEPADEVCIAGGAIAAESSDYSVYDSTFDSNDAEMGAAIGAGMSSGDIEGCTFTGNSSFGMFLSGNAASLADIGALTSAPLFGGIVSDIGGEILVSESAFSGNLVFGGPMSGLSSLMTAADCEFLDNEALIGSALVIGEDFLTSNVASVMGVTPQYSLPEGRLDMERCVVTGNDYAEAGVAALWADSYITNTLIADNEDLGTGVLAVSLSESALINSTIAGNNAEIGYANMMLAAAEADATPVGYATVINSIVWEGDDYSVMGAFVTASDLATGVAQFATPGAVRSSLTPLGVLNDYISEDPQFVSAAMGDYRLKAGSPCIDTGLDFELAPPDDLDNLSRPVDGDDDTVEAYDMGCYEFFGRTAGRLAGANRYRTAIEISKDHFAKADTVVLATGRTFADGLAASGLAGVFNAPLLLTDATELPFGVD